MTTTQHPGPVGTPSPAAGLIGELSSLQAGALRLGEQLTDPPTWADPAPAAQAGHTLGALEGQSPGFDAHSHLGTAVTTPSQHTVRSTAASPLDELAGHAERVRSASDDELGTVVPSYPRITPLYLHMAILGLVLLTVATIEYYVGRQQWERVLGGSPIVAARIALAVTLLLGVMSWMGAQSWFHRRPGVVRERGVVLFGVGAVLLLLFGAVMAYSFAGGIEAPTTGGFSGGTSADDVDAPAAREVEWVRWTIYVLVVALYGWTVAVAHLWYATAVDRRRVAVHVPVRLAAERASVTDPAALRRLRAATLRAIGECWHQGVARATTITTAYYSGVRSTLAPELLSTWDHRSVSDPTFTQPAWLQRLETAATDLEHDAHAVEGHSPEALPG